MYQGINPIYSFCNIYNNSVSISDIIIYENSNYDCIFKYSNIVNNDTPLNKAIIYVTSHILEFNQCNFKFNNNILFSSVNNYQI